MTIPFEKLKARLLANPKVKAEYDGRSSRPTRPTAKRSRPTFAPRSAVSSKRAAEILFMAVGSLIESSHAMPADTRGTLAGAMALAGIPESRSAAVLLCSIRIRQFAARLPERLARSPPG